MKNIKTYIPALCLALTLSLGLASCKEEDPFLDRDVAPVLVDIVGAAFGAPIARGRTARAGCASVNIAPA